MTTDSELFSQRILNWFDVHGRKTLPWQQPATPYRVWVSEIMLQQTQVSTVIPYFERFMDAFPTLEFLAKAQQDEVLALWSGLGYYARGRNLHKTAGIVSQQHHGQLPNTLEGLEALPGIGRSTAGAILSLGHKRYGAILDGNVKRVLARHFGISGWPGKAATLKQLWQVAEDNTPLHRFSEYNQAMMDMGALLCKRSSPDCNLCPVSSSCIALKEQRIAELPGKKPKKQKPTQYVTLALCKDSQGRILLEKRPPTGIWGGLWSLPELSKNQPDDADKANAEPLDLLTPWLKDQHIQADEVQYHPKQLKHVFSHFELNISLFIVQGRPLSNKISEPRYAWQSENASLGLPAAIKKLLQFAKTQQ